MASESKPGFSRMDAAPVKKAPIAPTATFKTSRPSRPQTKSEHVIEDEAECYYKFDGNKINIAIIFNHFQYNAKPPTESPGDRNGTEEDVVSITNTLTALNFTVKRYDDLTYAKINEVVKKVSIQDKSVINCIMVIVMTHGDEGNILWAYDTPYSANHLINPFIDPQSKLGGVPKLFFIQACRGSKIDKGVEHDGSVATNSIPTAADILTMYSTFRGFVAWREGGGSWFMQTLATQLLEHTEWDLLQILTRVNYQIAHEFKSTTLNVATNSAKQVSEFCSSLTKFFKFEKFKEDSREKLKRVEIFLRMLPN